MVRNKKWLISLLSVFLILVLAACSGNSGASGDDGEDTNGSDSSNSSDSGSTETQEISFWAPFSGADGPFMKKIVDDYNASQDDYQVDFQIVPQTDYYKTVDLSFNGGDNTPDVLIMHGDQIFTYSEKDILKPLDDILGGDVTAAQYHERGIEGATVNGEIYGLPLDIHPLMFYWNKDMFEAAGLDPEQPPTNREEFIEYAQKLTNADKNEYGYVVPTLWPQQFIFPTLVAQNGGELYTDGEVNFTAPEVVEALQFQRDLIAEYEVSPADVQQDGEVTLFLQGRNAMHLNGPWMLQQWVDAGMNFGVAPVPQLGTEQEAVFANSHNFVIPESVDDAKIDGILNFLRYVGDNTLAWAESGQAPAAKATYESDAFQEVNIQSPQVAKQFDDVVFSPDVENWGLAVDPLMEEINAALLGQSGVEEALQEAQDKASQSLEE
ncbi:ABC transporter substrate-binding protein [Paraliobacillus quinghaiensis]|uniref:ABC transporter substrate-binding protein n=1 Tax=Paraliobacillus quinghaiensis TaxID=470815 RepID=A0A917TUY4_9BACI|nr:ABC transporter substrate-binding protein [Paraliobacillus quinghaiensis]GGM38635.1 ABC transporter substrate-binding protein [Paraliobacillus quinghaiensis]